MIILYTYSTYECGRSMVRLEKLPIPVYIIYNNIVLFHYHNNNFSYNNDNNYQNNDSDYPIIFRPTILQLRWKKFIQFTNLSTLKLSCDLCLSLHVYRNECYLFVSENIQYSYDLLRFFKRIIIYHDFLPTPIRGSHVKSDKTHTVIKIHPLAHILDT